LPCCAKVPRSYRGATPNARPMNSLRVGIAPQQFQETMTELLEQLFGRP
jgi:hypothetical protein